MGISSQSAFPPGFRRQEQIEAVFRNAPHRPVRIHPGKQGIGRGFPLALKGNLALPVVDGMADAGFIFHRAFDPRSVCTQTATRPVCPKGGKTA